MIPATDLCKPIEPSIGRCVEDGIGGARDDLGPAPSVDIANGAPTGAGATNQIVNAWADGRDGLNHEHVLFATSTNGGGSWTAPRAIETAGDRGYYAAPAISPNGTDVWVVYNAFTTLFRDDTTSPRNLVGVVKHADVADGDVGAFTEVHRSPGGDPRGSSQNNLAAEFLGDYVYAAATRYLRRGRVERHTRGGRLPGDRRISLGAATRRRWRQGAGGRSGRAPWRGGRDSGLEQGRRAGDVAPRGTNACPETSATPTSSVAHTRTRRPDRLVRRRAFLRRATSHLAIDLQPDDLAVA